MDIDSPPPSFSPRHLIIQRLAIIGVPEEYLEDLQPGLVHCLKNKNLLLPDIFSAILPAEIDIAGVSEVSMKRSNLKDNYRESMLWMKWLMFEDEPNVVLQNLANRNVDQRGVCGAVWGENDLAFHCKTCEHDPTCAICVPCFQNGNHKNHDYSIIYTRGGCCDCGDETAWKREGFCSKHKGAEQMQPLPDETANSVGPVLDLLLGLSKDKLLDAEEVLRGNSTNKYDIDLGIVANDFSDVVVEMLLDFCNHSESLLNFASKRLIETDDLLNLLVRAERFLLDSTKKLHELLLKLLGEPTFKYEFSKAFINYYPVVMAEVVSASSDSVLKKYALLSMFSVQIFTVPTLTPRLVKEQNLLAVLFECLGEILFCCVEDGHFQFNKWVGVFDACIRVMGDIKFVLSHSAVINYVVHERMDIVNVWIQILSLVQGINAQKRETSIHIEEEHENAHLPFYMSNFIMNIHMLLVEAAFSVVGRGEMDEEASRERERRHIDDEYSQRHAKVGRLSEESSICSSIVHSKVSEGASQKFDGNHDLVIFPSVLHLTSVCTKVIDCWLSGSNVACIDTNDISHSKLLAFKASLLRIKNEMSISGSSDGSTMIVEHSHLGAGSGDLQAQPATHPCVMDTGDLDKDMSIMETEPCAERESLVLLSLSDWPDIDYDVSSQEISVHIPLHGLLSLILKEALKRYYGEYVLTDKGGNFFPSPSSSDRLEFFWKVLGGCHPNGFSSFMMEHPLQSRVFCSQVRAGMWRKNGDAAIVCFDLYRAIGWSDHKLQLDLFLLQLCAAFAPPDLYVRRILERFQLSNYLALDLKRSSEYEPVLMQELLTLIIQIVKERRFSGMTTFQSLQRELVCKLAIGDTTHSQFTKSLPKDLSKLDQLQDVLDKIAQYSNPSGMNQGKYSLQMPYWKELDLYHPCWNLRDLQVAEERYSRLCGVSALSAQLPKWTNIYPPLVGIARVATCKTVVQVIRAVLFYAVFTDRSAESRSPDGVLITALHLLSLALDICSLERKSGNLSTHEADCKPLLAVATEEIEVGWHDGSGQQSLLSLMVLLMKMHRKETMASSMEAGNFSIASLVESLLKNFAELDSQCMMKLKQFAPEIVDHTIDGTVNLSSASDAEKRKMKARERQAAVLAKMKAEQSKFLATMKTSAVASDDSGIGKEDHASDILQDSGEIHVCCLCHDLNSRNPVSFLILLQKSRLVTFVNNGPPSWDQGWQSDEFKSSVTCMRTDLPADAANAVSMEHFSHFFQLIEGSVDEFAAQAEPAELTAFVNFFKSQFPELRNFNVSGKSTTEKREKTAYSLESLEQDIFLSTLKEISFFHDSDIMGDGEGTSSKVDAAIARHEVSLLLGKYVASLTKEPKSSSQNSNLCRAEPAVHFSSDEFGPSDCDGIHVSSCGHAVHQECLDRYLSSLKDRHIRRMVFEGGHIVDPDRGEVLCPVCRRLSNSTLPAVPGDSHKLWELPRDPTASSSSSLTVSNEESGCLQLQYAVAMVRTAASFVSKGKMLKTLPTRSNTVIISNLEPVFQLLTGMYFSAKQDTLVRSGRVSSTVLMWATLKYSLISTEIAARCGKTSLSSRKGLNSLDDECRSSGGFILPLLLKIIQITRSKNLPDLLLRFRGLQLFSASICSGSTDDKFETGASGGDGKILRLLRYSNDEMVFPDMQFWDQASDPILIHDPFSTLMWILFCLPYPFLSSRESFISLVHLFYGVSIIQAICTYFLYSQFNKNELCVDDSLVSDIAKLTEKSTIIKHIFISDYIDPSIDVKGVINNLSLPYLRRCLLLWKLLKCSATSTSPSRSGDFGKSLDMSHCQEASCLPGDVDEINKLRNMFEIPSLDIVLKDGGLRGMMLKWFHHLSKKFEDRFIQHPLHLTPTVPFQLMRLPVVYQDLVQRYIKIQCPSCEVVQDDPALCLLCGRLCSAAWKSCCSESGCQAHAASCGAGTGVFLLVKKTTILLQRNERQAPWLSPYLDAFGEEDINMQRGKPLYLNEERYAALTYMVASHGPDRSSKVLRQTTIGTFFMV